MMNDNPYNPLQPVSDPTRFYGREQALAFLKLNLSGRVNHKALVIMGQQGIGKSSLLSYLPLVVDERYPTIHIDLSSLDLSSPVALVAMIVDKTRLMMNTIQASTYRLPAFPDPTDPAIDLLQWLAVEFLDVVMAAIRRERHLVLMLDNVELLFDAVEQGHFPVDFMGYLQNLLEHHDQLDVLATMSIADEQRVLAAAPFDDPNFHFRLTVLTPEESHALMTEPIMGYYQLAPQALSRVLVLAGGHPFLLQSIGRLIFRRWEEARHIDLITETDLESIYPAALEMAGETIDKLWEALSVNERLALTAMLDLRHQQAAVHPNDLQVWLQKTEYPLNELQLAAVLRSLEYWDIVRSVGQGRYAFTAELQADWLARYHAVQADELQSPVNTRFSIINLGIALAVLVVIVVGALALNGWNNDNQQSPLPNTLPTSTLGLDLAATRQADYLTQTAIASITPSPIPSETPRPTPTITPLPPFRFGG